MFEHFVRQLAADFSPFFVAIVMTPSFSFQNPELLTVLEVGKKEVWV
jgi:hypothetical protein